MRRIISYNDSISDENLIQLIGESEKHEPESNFSEEDNKLFMKNTRICQLLNNIEFTIESYGITNFFIRYDDHIDELKELGVLLGEIGDNDAVKAINQALSFYQENEGEFKYLKNSPEDFDEKFDSLDERFENLEPKGNSIIFNIPLHKSISLIASFIREKPNNFFTNNLVQ